MEKISSFGNAPRIIVVIIVLFLLGLGFFGSEIGNIFKFKTMPQKSVEVGVVSTSPKGALGGFAIPASCPSYEHSPGECAPPAPSFSGTNNQTGGGGGAFTINQGGGVTLTWNASSATNCSGVNFSTGGPPGTSGSVVLSPSSSTTYTLVCNYLSNYSPTTAQSSVGVTVLNPVLSISANPVSVRSGRSSTITWSASAVDSCTVTGPGGFSQTALSGSAPSGALTQQSVFVLTCQNSGGSVSASVTVTIIPAFEEF